MATKTAHDVNARSTSSMAADEREPLVKVVYTRDPDNPWGMQKWYVFNVPLLNE